MDNHSHSEFPAWSLANEATGEQGVGYGEFVIPLIKSVQELSAKNEELFAELNTLQAQISGSSDFSTLKTVVTGT